MKELHKIYESRYIIILTNGQMFIAQLEKVGRRYFWTNNLLEIALNCDNADIAQATPID